MMTDLKSFVYFAIIITKYGRSERGIQNRNEIAYLTKPHPFISASSSLFECVAVDLSLNLHKRFYSLSKMFEGASLPRVLVS